MSFGIYLETVATGPCPTCGHADRSETVWSISGVTHNLNEIVDRCLIAAGSPVARRGDSGYRERSWGRLEGWTAAEALPVVERALAECISKDREAEFLQLERERCQGWGSLAGLCVVFQQFKEALEQHPRAVIRTSG